LRIYPTLALFIFGFSIIISLSFYGYSSTGERILATVIFEPETLNLKEEGVITAFIELPSPYDVNNIDVSTVSIEGVVPASWGKVEDNRLTVKFDSEQVIDFIWAYKLGHMRIIMPQENYGVDLKVIGQITDGITEFEGVGTITVINPGFF